MRYLLFGVLREIIVCCKRMGAIDIVNDGGVGLFDA